MRRRSSNTLAPLNELDFKPIDRTKPMIVPRTRENKYDPKNCEGKGAAARRLRALERQRIKDA